MAKTFRATFGVRFGNAMVATLLRTGVRMGPMTLLTVRGRKSGLPRSTPVAIIDVSGRRWIWAPWGDVNWVRNLRAAGHATITFRRRDDEVRIHAQRRGERERAGDVEHDGPSEQRREALVLPLAGP